MRSSSRVLWDDLEPGFRILEWLGQGTGLL